jgi:hypothetical protein
MQINVMADCGPDFDDSGRFLHPSCGFSATVDAAM